MATMHDTPQLIGRSLAAGFLALHLFVVAMAMSPALHHWLHGDADEPDHQCAVTAMIDGQFDRPDAPALAMGQPCPIAEIFDATEPAQPLSACSYALPGERAPPRA